LGLESAYRPTGRPPKVGRNQNASPGQYRTCPAFAFLSRFRFPAPDKVVRPGVTVLERMIVTARRRAEHETMRRLAVVLDGPGRSLLDGLLIPDESTGQTPLSWLRRGEVANTPAAILAALERRATLVGWGVDRWDLKALPFQWISLMSNAKAPSL
jgi:hypothetical protein